MPYIYLKPRDTNTRRQAQCEAWTLGNTAPVYELRQVGADGGEAIPACARRSRTLYTSCSSAWESKTTLRKQNLWGKFSSARLPWEAGATAASVCRIALTGREVCCMSEGNCQSAAEPESEPGHLTAVLTLLHHTANSPFRSILKPLLGNRRKLWTCFLDWLLEPRRLTVWLQVQEEKHLWEQSQSRLESGRWLPASRPKDGGQPSWSHCAEGKWLTCGVSVFLTPRTHSKTGSQTQLPFWREGGPLYLWTMYFLTRQIETFAVLTRFSNYHDPLDVKPSEKTTNHIHVEGIIKHK